MIPPRARVAAAAAAWASAAAATAALCNSTRGKEGNETPDEIEAPSAGALRVLADLAAAAQRALADFSHAPDELDSALERSLGSALAALAPPTGLLAAATSARHSSGSAVTIEESEEDGSGIPPVPGSAPASPVPPHSHVVALFSFSSTAPNEISMRQGDVIEVLTTHESGWWNGRARNGHTGFFPSNYCRPLTDAELSRLQRKRVARRARRAEARGASRHTSSTTGSVPASPIVSRAPLVRKGSLPTSPAAALYRTRPHGTAANQRISAECV